MDHRTFFLHSVSLGKYALLSSFCPEEGRLGVTQHNIITSHSQGTAIPESQRFMRNQDISTPEETDNASNSDSNQKERSLSTRFHSLCVNVYQHTD